MCFSAPASFIASGIAAAAGIASLSKISSPKQIPFAGIPLIFAVQQFCEGILWIALEGNNNLIGLKIFLLYTFLFFAQVVWPFWVPFSVLLMESSGKRKKILYSFFLGGTLVAIFFSFRLFTNSVSVIETSHHLNYSIERSLLPAWLSGMLYLAPTVFSLFASSVKKMKLLGVLLLSSFIVSMWFYSDYVISVWCYFAAVISVVVFLIIRNQK